VTLFTDAPLEKVVALFAKIDTEPRWEHPYGNPGGGEVPEGAGSCA
jgi:hypothetical protein